MSDATVAILRGPQGEGKTHAGTCKPLRAYQLDDNKLRGLLLRDTLENILSKTVIDIKKALEPMGSYPEIRDRKRMTFHGFPDLGFELVGMNDKSALNRIQGGGYNYVWVEEAAPVFEEGMSGVALGVPLEAFLTALSRAAREGRGQVAVTMNPGSEEHWSHDLFVENPLQPCEAWPDITTELFDIPYGENKHLSDTSRQLTKAAYSRPGMEAYYKRFVEGRSSFMVHGAPVVPNYREKTHFSKEELFPVPDHQVLRFWDGGLNPTCTICQIMPSGRLFVLDCFISPNAGLKQLIRWFVTPAIGRKYGKINQWRDIGDPAMLLREQSSSEMNSSVIIKQELDGNLEPGEKWWEPRRRACIEVCDKLVDGEPMFLVSKTAGKLNRAFRGGWYFKTDSNGNIAVVRGKETLPMKNIHSHPGDSMGHGLPVIFPRQKRPPKKRRPPPRTVFSRIHRQTHRPMTSIYN